MLHARQIRHDKKKRNADLEAGVPSDQIYLLPGGLCIPSGPCRIVTILGSCVAVCLWDFSQHRGGMNHFLLPVCHEQKGSSMRFGNIAIPALLDGLLAAGCRRAHIGAKVFGGAALFQKEDAYASSLGAKNVAVALQLLNDSSIPVLGQDIGGDFGRKIVFNTEDGTVWARRL